MPKLEAEVTINIKFGPFVTQENIDYFIKNAAERVSWMPEVKEAALVNWKQTNNNQGE